MHQLGHIQLCGALHRLWGWGWAKQSITSISSHSFGAGLGVHNPSLRLEVVERTAFVFLVSSLIFSSNSGVLFPLRLIRLSRHNELFDTLHISDLRKLLHRQEKEESPRRYALALLLIQHHVSGV